MVASGCDAVAPPLLLRLFGPFEVQVNGRPLPRLRTRKGYHLFALLTLRHACDVDRSWLAGTLWPDSPEPAALISLRASLKDLRQALGPEAHRLRSPTPRTLSLDLEGADVDLLAFDAAIARGDGASLEEGVGRYRGMLLEGWEEEWVFQERQAREEAYLAALEQLAADAMGCGEAAKAARWLRRAVGADPLRESARRGLMQALAHGGEYAGALEVYRELRLLLHRELNAEPDAETRNLYEQIRNQARGLAGRSGVQAFRRSGVQETESGAPAHPLTPSPPHPLVPTTEALEVEPIGGAVPLDSAFYVVRPIDREFHEALARRDSVVLIKGAREMGKTSLLGRGLQQARQAGFRVVQTDFQLLSAAHLASAEAFYLAVGSALADQLGLDVLPHQVWAGYLGANMNFNRYVGREVLSRLDTPLVWGMDQVDVLATCDFGTEVFSLLRAWHNQRVTDPGGPWSRLSLVIAYATEAHLFIADINQSPFNVGTRVTLDDFTVEQVEDLNRRHGSPLRDRAEVERFFGLVGGHPTLVRRGFHEMAAHGVTLAAIEAEVGHDEGIFGDHLRRLLALLGRDPVLQEAACGVLQGRPCLTVESFYRLRSAGILAGDSLSDAHPRCRLYAAYLERHLL